ncbi:hypothetical protein FQN54_001735 [Arachnomyces sp. PD_36]|nr:hypothetical protein FQN54_001735 [Arachnomyces sp. PD_36]
MASYSPAPTSPTAAGASQLTSNPQNPTHRSDTPPTATNNPPQSKRDKRRTALQDRLQEITNSFAQNRDLHFRQQLHALQYDMNLIANADLYESGPLDDSAEGIGKLIDQAVAGGQFPAEMKSMAGRWYAKFVQEVNWSKEHKDAELTVLMNRHNNNLARLKHECDFRLHLAAQECDQMAATLRERLIQTVSQKRARLMREKEQLDIADTNALLLHPNQFSITNPSSPGGLQSNRKTRHTRHRVDMDEFGNGIVSEPIRGKGAKKKAPVADDDLGSPVRDGGATTPAERAKILQQQAPPTYSLNSLFTDKELAMNSNTAHVATAHFFSVSKKANNQGGRLASQGPNIDGDETPGDGTGQEDNNATPGAPDMERTASQNFHATRSTRGQGGTAALNLLGELADKTAARPPLPYFTLNNYPGRVNNNHVPPPSTLMPEEIDDDMAKIERLMNSKPQGWIDKGLLDQVLPENYSIEEGSLLGGAGSLDLRFPIRMDVHLVPLKRSGGSSVLGGSGSGSAAKRQKVT